MHSPLALKHSIDSFQPMERIDSVAVSDEPTADARKSLFMHNRNGSQYWSKIADSVYHHFNENKAVIVFFGLLNLFVIYIEDIRLGALDTSADLGVEVAVSICFFIFVFEIILKCACTPKYLSTPMKLILSKEPINAREFVSSIGSFHFWLDTSATISLILQMKWMIGEYTYNLIRSDLLYLYASTIYASSILSIVARTIRIVRAIQYVRFVKIRTFTKSLVKTVNIKEKDAQPSENVTSKSRVGKALSDKASERVVLLILIVVIIVSLLIPRNIDSSRQVSVAIIDTLYNHNQSNPELYASGLNTAIDRTKESLSPTVIRFNSVEFYKDSDWVNTLRVEEVTTLTKSSSFIMGDQTYYSTTEISFNQKSDSVNAALLSIYFTTFLLVLLRLGIYIFSSEVKQLVIRPIERLVDLVKKISVNPLNVEYNVLGEEHGFFVGLETTILMNTINKIGGLMRVGFGEAGARTISKTLAGNMSGELNLMGGTGRMINSIFGFCDVRQFTDTTECLQEEVMLFVNRIAHILHGIVVQCSGAANKNIGDAFLLTWKVGKKLLKEEVSKLADQALLAFCKTLVELSRYQKFICNFSIGATGRLYKRFPEYNVRIGSGLHYGWAIEGAIGSNHKIDASYLSPHVNFTEFLESSTKAYGVALLMSDAFYDLLSNTAKQYCRQVDRIRRSALEEPISMYTYDADLSIDWNDMHRHKKKTKPKGRLFNAVKAVLKFKTKGSPSVTPSALSMNRARSAQYEASPHAVTETSTDHDGNKHHHQSTDSPSNHERNPMMHKAESSPAVNKSHSTSVRTLVDMAGNHGESTSHLGKSRRQSLLLLNSFDTNGDLNHNNVGALDKATSYKKLMTDIENHRPDANKVRDVKVPPTITIPPYTDVIWTSDPDIVEMRHLITDDMRDNWREGMEFFLNGDWIQAKRIFSDVNQNCHNKDGPSKFLLEVINSAHGQPPANWEGYRDEGGDGH